MRRRARLRPGSGARRSGPAPARPRFRPALTLARLRPGSGPALALTPLRSGPAPARLPPRSDSGALTLARLRLGSGAHSALLPAPARIRLPLPPRSDSGPAPARPRFRPALSGPAPTPLRSGPAPARLPPRSDSGALTLARLTPLRSRLRPGFGSRFRPALTLARLRPGSGPALALPQLPLPAGDSGPAPAPARLWIRTKKAFPVGCLESNDLVR